MAAAERWGDALQLQLHTRIYIAVFSLQNRIQRQAAVFCCFGWAPMHHSHHYHSVNSTCYITPTVTGTVFSMACLLSRSTKVKQPRSTTKNTKYCYLSHCCTVQSLQWRTCLPTGYVTGICMQGKGAYPARAHMSKGLKSACGQRQKEPMGLSCSHCMGHTSAVVNM